MSRRISSRIFIGALTLAAAACMTLADARAFDESKYPEWYGQWTRPNGVSNQWDPTKPGGPAQQAPLKPEYQAIYEANLADQKTGGKSTDPLFAAFRRHAAADDRGVPDGGHHHAGHHLHGVEQGNVSAASTRTGATGRRIRSRRSRAIRSASGRILTATAATICSRSRPAASVARAPMSRAAFRCTPTTRPSSRSASTTTRSTRASSTTRSPPSTTRSPAPGPCSRP